MYRLVKIFFSLSLLFFLALSVSKCKRSSSGSDSHLQATGLAGEEQVRRFYCDIKIHLTENSTAVNGWANDVYYKRHIIACGENGLFDLKEDFKALTKEAICEKVCESFSKASNPMTQSASQSRESWSCDQESIDPPGKTEHHPRKSALAYIIPDSYNQSLQSTDIP